MGGRGKINLCHILYIISSLQSATNRAAVTIPFGKKKCRCDVDCKCKNGDCSKSKITCDKKCSGVAKAVPIEGCGIIDAKASKGKVKISSCTCGGGNAKYSVKMIHHL